MKCLWFSSGGRFNKSPFLWNLGCMGCCSRQRVSAALSSDSVCVSISCFSLFPEEIIKYFFSILMNNFKSCSFYLLIFCLSSELLFWVVWFGIFLFPLQHYTLAAAGDVAASGQRSILWGYRGFPQSSGFSAWNLMNWHMSS